MIKAWAVKRVWRNCPKAIHFQTHTGRWNRPGCSHYHILSSRHSNSVSGRRKHITQYQSKDKMLLYKYQPPRTFVTAAIPSLLVPPLIFVGLLLALWTWKCFWIVVLQDKLLYLSWLPPLARSEKIADYEAECRPVQWTEKQIRSLDGTKLAVCEGRIPVHSRSGRTTSTTFGGSVPQSTKIKKRKSVVICYFQGNGGSTPLRLPLLSQVLRTIKEKSKSTPLSTSPSDGTEFTIVALSYRGYWTSSGRATQSGIELDAQAFLNWVSETYTAPDTDLEVILWGHSLGSAIASSATATYLSRHNGDQSSVIEAGAPRPVNIAGLILEAPSSSIKDMLISLYPQKWLPYRYLWPFSWNHWSCTTAMERIARWRDQNNERNDAIIQGAGSGAPMLPRSGHSCARSESFRSPPPILLLSAESDEVIPPHVADGLESDGERLGLELKRKGVRGALHTEAPVKVDGREALVNFIFQCTSPRAEGA
ncbi:Alpha/Beta hydrolase protein [Aspergillus tamarii]|uniref:Alpha/Beta hydrolase protein n=1 Tax=Aspergillus tamarii TaxID=41984 RepID=A0A5N6UWJ6_ASPTM|nr:Alpha/Beta hydrolase protein [Aspergillus tamarii]